MSVFNFYYPIQIRYGDLDPQWHVNHARTVSLFESARMAYLISLGLFDGESFFDLESIVVDLHLSYLAPIQHTLSVKIGVRVVRIGNKSLSFEEVIENSRTGQLLARAEVVIVAYDYHHKCSKPVSENWRKAISAFEGISAYPINK